ncbi:MAG TPA: 50S ribosomal protein L34e [Candidatus Nanoarchaeia archaeon]|nr:50S ribosomal protein L34e [Candidatus Nanoarchaeia archaeon]
MARIEMSRKRRIKYTRTPGSSVKITRIAKKPSKPVCSKCKKPLHGISNLINKQQRKLTKSKKRPERRFPGLCSKCSRRELINTLRG